MQADRENIPIPADTSFTINYALDQPVVEGVVTDCPYMSPQCALTLSARAVAVLRPLLTAAGGLFPATPYREQEYQTFACTTQIDALDRSRTEFFPVSAHFGPDRIRRYALRPGAVAAVDIFRVKGILASLFVSDRFVEAVSRHRLTGFRIRPVWSSESGPLVTFDNPGVEFERFPPGRGSTKREKRRAMRDVIEGRG